MESDGSLAARSLPHCNGNDRDGGQKTAESRRVLPHVWETLAQVRRRFRSLFAAPAAPARPPHRQPYRGSVSLGTNPLFRRMQADIRGYHRAGSYRSRSFLQEPPQLFKFFCGEVITQNISFAYRAVREVFRSPPSRHVVPSLRMEWYVFVETDRHAGETDRLRRCCRVARHSTSRSIDKSGGSVIHLAGSSHTHFRRLPAARAKDRTSCPRLPNETQALGRSRVPFRAIVP